MREVLGVKNYICPQSLQQIRQLEGELPTPVLVIVLEVLTEAEKKLLQKILSSMNFHQYSLLQIKEPAYTTQFILEGLELANVVFVFGGEEITLSSKNTLFQTSYSLKELNRQDNETSQKKKNLWEQLKVWKDNAFSTA